MLHKPSNLVVSVSFISRVSRATVSGDVITSSHVVIISNPDDCIISSSIIHSDVTSRCPDSASPVCRLQLYHSRSAEHFTTSRTRSQLLLAARHAASGTLIGCQHIPQSTERATQQQKRKPLPSLPTVSYINGRGLIDWSLLGLLAKIKVRYRLEWWERDLPDADSRRYYMASLINRTQLDSIFITISA